MLQQEYEFDLPKGYADQDGILHRHGFMRLATARDEISAMSDPRVKMNPDYATIVVLSRVIVRLGSLERITPETLEGLFTSDMSFLQNMYQTINEVEDPVIHVQCPHCGKTFRDTINFCLGE